MDVCVSGGVGRVGGWRRRVCWEGGPDGQATGAVGAALLPSLLPSIPPPPSTRIPPTWCQQPAWWSRPARRVRAWGEGGRKGKGGRGVGVLAPLVCVLVWSAGNAGGERVCVCGGRRTRLGVHTHTERNTAASVCGQAEQNKTGSHSRRFSLRQTLATPAFLFLSMDAVAEAKAVWPGASTLVTVQEILDANK